MLNFIVSTYLPALEVGEISFWICPWGLGEVFKITELLMWIPPLFPKGLGVGVTMACSTSRNTGTREHGTPEHHGTFWNTRKIRNTPKKTRNTPRKPGTPQENPEHPQENPEHLEKKPRNLKKQIYRQYVTARVSFPKLPPLITHKIIWFDIHNLENIYKRHTGTILF